MLPKEELVEQAYFFRILSERIGERLAMQDLLKQVKYELLVSTKLPMAVDFLLTELLHGGAMGPAMRRMQHYFTPFQTFLVDEAEYDRGRFGMQTAVKVLQHDAEYRSGTPTPQGCFLYQFETLCRNRLRYDPGLKAMSEDPIYDADWSRWILEVRHQIGLVDMADMIFLRSEEYVTRKRAVDGPDFQPKLPPLFGEHEGRMAMANHHKDPLFLFAALQRHLGYPKVPRATPADLTVEIIPQLLRRMERLETRLKIMEEEQRHGLDITKFYVDPKKRPDDSDPLSDD
ncbi:hypothetical protein Poly24_23240 [Rosistilla carotiformis]|uniref:Uncharacterized protein n=1 Tax=Rosistilla carotiformis TaxID=2528017 RepID=A0A518JSU3_9BACT|nr:hypothetical protein [Rosistilla carotiformis]QDV68614.1 hypothetical protein Poly24_23240 [Rosistilla carotiformis]